MSAELSSASDRAQRIGNSFNIWLEVGSETGNFQNEHNLKQRTRNKIVPPDAASFAGIEDHDSGIAAQV